MTKPKNTVKSTTNRSIVRRKKADKGRTVSQLTEAEKFQMITLWKSGSATYPEVADQFNIKSVKLVEKYINKIIQELNIVKETNSLVDQTFHCYHQAYKPSNLINEEFLELLSGEDDELSDNEFSYVYLLAFTGDHRNAILTSKLDAGLKKYESHETAAYSNALRIRGIFLRQKKNIKRKLEEFRKQKLDELSKDINKDWVVNELVDQLDKLKESGENPRLILDTIDKIGKTCGAFVERVEVSEITASTKLQELISRAKEEVILMEPIVPLRQIEDKTTTVYEAAE